ncbi:MAG TPA: GH3 auxin-responsive promoter family protein [Chloroflexota bacterium]|nr:GH3 auxin-responsive promoter family protein [Chloroflexota bacterium]
MSSVFGRLLRAWLRFSDADRFDNATWDPAAAQEGKLLEIVRRNQDTEYGRTHGFASIRSIRDYQQRVPVNSYDTLSPFVDRMLAGEPGVLTADKPIMFATTSGTTGRSKYIPVTPSFLHEYSHGVHLHTYRILTDFQDVLDGTIVVSSGSDEEGKTEGGTPYGAISGYLNRTQPGPIRRYYAVPYEVGKLKQVDQKYYVTLRYALASDVRAVVTPNPSSLILLSHKMTQFADELIHDINSGTINQSYVPPEMAARLKRGVRADMERAAFLRRVLARTGRLTPVDVWPNLRVLSCWKGGSMPLYLRRLPEHYGDLPIRDLGYMASEGRGASPLVNSGSGGTLNITSHFFEFVREDDRDNPLAEFLRADQLEPNCQYYIFFTTSSGFYRYDINDVVRVVDFYRNTPVVQFVRKGQGISSLTGEKLTEPQVTESLVDVTRRMQLPVEHVTACPEWDDPPHYAFYVETALDLDRDTAAEFLLAMDRALASRNEEYESKRTSQRLGMPVFKRVAPGEYEALRQKRVAAGAPEAQVKIPHLSPDMRFGQQLNVLDEVRVESEKR